MSAVLIIMAIVVAYFLGMLWRDLSMGVRDLGIVALCALLAGGVMVGMVTT